VARLTFSHYSVSCTHSPRPETLAVRVGRVDNTVIELTYCKHNVEIACEFFQILSSLRIEPYVHTHRVVLSSSMPSHSHPTLTIHETHVTPELLPAVFLHEQMHWRLTQSKKTPVILASLRRAFLTRPDFDPVHLAVCRLEVCALTALLGRYAAHSIVRKVHRYQGEYQVALFDSDVIEACLGGLGPEKIS